MLFAGPRGRGTGAIPRASTASALHSGSQTMRAVTASIAFLGLILLAGCGSHEGEPPPVEIGAETPQYIIGPLDSLSVFVWRNPELSTGAVVRPDGRVTLPLVEDLDAAGKTPVQLARSEEHTSELQSLMRLSYAVFCLKKINTA